MQPGRTRFQKAPPGGKGRIETNVYIGKGLREYNLLGGSSEMKLVDDRAALSLDRTPLLVGNVNIALLKFHLNIKFESRNVPCRLQSQKVTYSFTNYFGEAFDGTFKLKFPESWDVDEPSFTFQNVASGETRNASLMVSIPQQASITTKMITFDINLHLIGKKGRMGRPSYRLKVKRPLTLSSMIGADVIYLPKKRALRIKVINHRDFPVTVDVYPRITGQRTGIDSVSLPKKGERTIFVPITVKDPAGKKVRIGLREQGGDHFCNVEYTIPKDSEP